MPRHQSAKKRVRQAAKRRERNQSQRSKMRTLVKKVLETEEKKEAEKYYREAVSYLDKMASRGLIHQNKAARRKAKLTKHVNNL